MSRTPPAKLVRYSWDELSDYTADVCVGDSCQRCIGLTLASAFNRAAEAANDAWHQTQEADRRRREADDIE